MRWQLLFILMLIFASVACIKDTVIVSTATPVPVSEIIPPSTPVATASPFPTQTLTLSFAPSHTPTTTPTPTTTNTATPTPSPISVAWVALGTKVPIGPAPISSDNSWQIQELARWGRGTIVDIDLSADGQWIAVASGAGVYIHNRYDLSAEPQYIDMGRHITSVAISPTGDKVAIIVQDLVLQVWQVEPAQKLFEITEATQARFSRDFDAAQPQFSPDGSVLAVANETSVELRNSEDGTVLASYANAYYPNIRFSPSGSRVAVWDKYDDVVKVYDWRTNEQILRKQTPIHPEGEGEYQALIGDVVFITENDVRLLIIEGFAFVTFSGRLEIQDTSDAPLLFSVDGIPPLTGTTSFVCNEPVVYWDPPEPPTPDNMQIAPEAQIMAMRYTGLGYSGDFAEYSSVQFYHMQTGQRIYAVDEGIVDFELAPDGQTWIAGLQDGRLQVRQLSDGAVLEGVDAYDAPILDINISPDSQWVGVIYVDQIKIYRVEDSQVSYRYLANHLDFAPDSQSFALAYDNGLIELRGVTDGEIINQMAAHQDKVTAVRYLSSDEILSTGFDCHTTRWHIPDLTPLNSLENVIVEGFHTGEPVPMRVRDFLLGPEKDVVIGLFFSYGYAVWDVEDGRLLYASTEDEYGSLLAISPHGLFIAKDGGIEALWTDSLIMLDVLGTVAEFSPDSNLLVTGVRAYERAGNIQIWQIPEMTLLYTKETQTNQLMAIDFSFDGRLMMSGALDGIIRLWGIPPEVQ